MDELTAIDNPPSADGADAGPSMRRASSIGINTAILQIIEGDGGGADKRLTAAREARVGELTQLLADEQAREAARNAFAQAANAVNEDLESKTKALASLDGEPEAQVEALQEMAAAHQESKVMEPAEAASTECDNLGVVINPYTPETIFTLRSQWDEVGKAYSQARSVAEKAIMDKAGTQLTPEQIAEIREVFDYFDEDKDGLLSLKEFQDGCQGMGMVMDQETSEQHYQNLNGGKELSFELFSEFMVEQMKTGTSLDDVIAAFRSLASGDTISDEVIVQHFTSREDYAQYLANNMPTTDDGTRDFVAFTNELFTR